MDYQKRYSYQWNSDGAEAFNVIKQKIVSAPVLACYDAELSLYLSTDASLYGLGAVLNQLQKDESINPISFASRSLCSAEQGYSVIDKETLALVFGVKKLKQYLFCLNSH